MSPFISMNHWAKMLESTEISGNIGMKWVNYPTVNFEHISHLVLVFLLLTLSR